MGSKVVVTYKRKLLFSRRDHSLLSLSSDKTSKVLGLKASANLDNHDVSVGQHTMQNKDTHVGISHKLFKDRDGENMKQCDECDSQDWGQCSEKNSSLSNQTQNPTLKQKTMPQESHLNQVTSHPNASLEVKSGLEYEDKCKDGFLNDDNDKGGKYSNEYKFKDTSPGIESVLISSKASDGIDHSHQAKESSVSGTFSSEERRELNNDRHGTLCNSLGTKRRFTSTLITFCRRSKRNKDNGGDKCASVTPLAKKFSVDVKTEKKSPDDSDNNLCSLSIQDAAVPMFVENKLHSPRGTEDFQISHKEIPLSGESACTGLQDNRHAPQELLSMKDVNNSKNKASCDIDCNIPPVDFSTQENHLPRPLVDVHDSLGSTNDCNKKFPTENPSPMRAVVDKDKFVQEPPALKNRCIQLFPESTSNGAFRLGNNLENSTRLPQSTLQSPRVRSEQMLNGSAAYYPSLYEPFLDLFPQSTIQSSRVRSAHLMMLDSILSRARGQFEYPTTWSEEELDCLWIGVRRHGVNNWDTILRDPRLHFPPWKTARDLAERWQKEQYRLFCSPDLSLSHTVSFLDTRAKGVVNQHQFSQQNPLHDRMAQWRPSAPFMVTNEYLPKALPHWLREAVGTPPNLDCSGGSRGPWLNTGNSPVWRIDLRNCGRADNKQDDPIVIVSDASSEETVSDDHSVRS